MSRYIDADEILEHLDLMYDKQDDWREPYNTGVLGAINYIKHRAPSIDLVKCAECRWARPRTLIGETGYRCLFYRVDKAENGYCDCGERSE